MHNTLVKAKCLSSGIAHTTALISAILAFASMLSAQTETLLHSFREPTGWYPYSGVAADHNGNLYGTTYGGGTEDVGVVYKLSRDGQYTILRSFTMSKGGEAPYSAPVTDNSGNLYGTTEAGGLAGCGVVYRIDPSGGETDLYSFTCGADGGLPFGGVTSDAAGNLYGTTSEGGSSGFGVVFKLDPNGNETVLHSFTGYTDGNSPYSGVVRDGDGNLYGTTQAGGAYGHGIVYRIDIYNRETILHNFAGGGDGGYLQGGVVRDAAGNLYGCTVKGGMEHVDAGVIYKLDPQGRETVVHRFAASPTDGRSCYTTPVFDSYGNLYGSTGGGGAFGSGAIFKIDAVTLQESLIYSFGGTDGSEPKGALLIVNGSIYGTTKAGGNFYSGALFKITLAP